MGVTPRHSRAVGWQGSLGAGEPGSASPLTSRLRRVQHSALLLGLISLVWIAWPRVATAQVSEWQADPGCPAPTNLPLASLGRRADAPADDLSVRVTVTAVPGGWRAVLAASEHDGSPLGERVLEHPTCEELNRAVLVSLSVLLGTQSPVAPEEGLPAAPTDSTASPAPATTTPAPDETTAPNSPASAPSSDAALPLPASQAGPAAPASPVEPAAGIATAGEENNAPEERRESNAAAPLDEPPATNVSPLGSLPRPTFDIYGGGVFGLESTDARTLGGALSVLASNRDWGLRLNGGFRLSTGNVADNPDVRFRVASGSVSACKYFGAATWLVCAGPLVERLHGTVPEASNPDAEAWLLGGSVGVSTLRHTRDTWGWFAQLDVQVRRGASFQVNSPSTQGQAASRTVFSYPWVGLLLSLGPAVRL